MKKILIMMVFCVVLIVSLAGCSDNPLVGKWYFSDYASEITQKVMDIDPAELDEYVMEIKSNGTIVPNYNGPFSEQWSYRIEGDYFIIIFEDGHEDTPLYIDGDRLLFEKDGDALYVRK